MSRKRGRIILVGVIGLQLNRADFYEKELSFQVSCSYGPGRYDLDYEESGQDYPLGFVRWTEQRNFEAVLDLMASGQIKTSALLSHRFAFNNAPSAYDLLSTDKTALGIMLDYEHDVAARHNRSIILAEKNAPAATDNCNVGFIGAGNYASRMLIPAFKSAGATMHSIASAGGTNSAVQGRAAGFLKATSDTSAMLADAEIGIIAIATRHNSHARLTCDALNAGKHVFVEKPLALTLSELADVEDAHMKSSVKLMVGFNRRFAPQVQTVKRLLGSVKEPKSFIFVMNAGAIPADHWTQDQAVGGGRIVGEACHHIDLMRFFAGSPIVSVQARCMGQNDGQPLVEDKAVILLGFEDGSFGTIHYLANGGNSFPKERFEVFAAGATLQLDNFLKLQGFNRPGFRKESQFRQDKGQTNCAKAFMDSVKSGGPAPIPAEELFEVARVTIEVAEQLRQQG